MNNSATRSRWLYLVVIVLAGVVAGGVLGSWAARHGDPVFTSGLLSPAFANNNVAQPGQAPNMPDSFAPVIRPDLPGVVEVSAKIVVHPRTSMSPFQFNFPGFPQFQAPQQGPAQETVLGSGFIIRSDGIVLTNDHVVKNGKGIHVTLENGQQYKATVLGTDEQTDLAVLKIDAPGLTALPLGDSSQAHIGDIVFAVGNPLGLSNDLGGGATVTMGIISAKGRGGVEPGSTSLSIGDFLQTDAAINHGNSGGPLINTRGQVVGVDTAIATEGGQGNIGIGFAIPIDLAKNVADQIIAHGKVVRGQMGVSLQVRFTADDAQQLGLPKLEGALVLQVTPGGPADKAGIKFGDVILKINGRPVQDSNQLVLDVTELPPGTIVHLEVFRNGRTFPASLTLTQRPSGLTPSSQQASESSGPSGNNPMAGVSVQALTPDVISALNRESNVPLPTGIHGVIVSSVDPNSPAAEDLTRGVIIEEVNRRPVTSVSEYDDAVRANGDKPVFLYIYDPRSGGAAFVTIRPPNE